MASPPSSANANCFMRRFIRALSNNKPWGVLVSFAQKLKKIAMEDPRRIIHSLKVGLAITWVASFFYLQPFYNSFGDDAMWAVITVIVVMEFSVGATIGKGINRIMATLLGGCLGVGVQQFAKLLGKNERPIVITPFLYVIGTVITFMRFVPKVKARYDYGCLVFMLTYSLVSLSGYREDEIVDVACKRFLTIIIGSSIAMATCIFIFPFWNGDDLQNHVANNLEKLGNFLQGLGDDLQPKTTKSFAEEYESVLTSKTKEETMANFARWEPFHNGKFKFRHPWNTYLEIGKLTRQCASKIEALDSYLRSSVQKSDDEVGIKIKDSLIQCTAMECGKALKTISSSIKCMSLLSISSSTTKAHVAKAKCYIESYSSLDCLVMTSKSNDDQGGHDGFIEIVTFPSVSALITNSLITDVVKCIERIMEAVDELSSLAHFKTNNNVPLPSTTTTTSTIIKPLPLTREGILHPILESHDELRYCICNSVGTLMDDEHSSCLTTKGSDGDDHSSVKIIVHV